MLKKYASLEEFGPETNEPITVDDVYATYNDAEDEQLPESHARALETIDGLQEANEAWQRIVASAVKQNRVTPELCAGIESHFTRLHRELGETADEECASVEAAGDDVELFLAQVQSSLESFSGKLGKIKNAILDKMSKVWNNKADKTRQIESFQAIKTLAIKILQSVKEKHGSDLNKTVTLSTGRYTTAFTSCGKVTSEPLVAILRHMKLCEKLYSDTATKGNNIVIDIVNAAGRISSMTDIEAVVGEATAVTRLPMMSSFVPKGACTGDWLLGNLRLALPEETPALKPNENLLHYIARRSKYGSPHWEKAGPRAESAKITISYRDITTACKAIVTDVDALIKWFEAMDKSTKILFQKIDAIKENNNPFKTASYAFTKALLEAVASDTAGRMTPVQQLAYKNMVIFRGWLGLFSKA